jgi:DNA-binding transcriptional ArsR family regulator
MSEILAIAKALGDESRARALAALRDGELCLCQVIEVLGLSPSTVSKHMTVLLHAGLVERRKAGKWHFYRLAGEHASPAVRSGLAWALAALRTDSKVRADAARIREVRGSDLEELSACYRS